MHYVYNPVGFDHTETLAFLKKNNVRSNVKWEDYIRLFVHTLLHVLCKYNADDDEYVPLQGRSLFKQVHTDYATTRAIQHALINAEVIQCDGRYFPSEKCYGFRFTDAYRRQCVQPWLITEEAIIRRKRKNKSEVVTTLPAHKAVWYWINKIEIDYDSALRFLKENTTNEDNILQKSCSLEKLHTKDLFFHTDDQGRVYHNVACLWSQFRQFLTINKRQLVNVDIRNSQPLFFAVKLREHYNPYSPYYYNAQETSKRVLEQDVMEYIELCENGTLYDYLMDKFGYDNRRAFKKRFFALFYSKPNTERKLNKQFQHLFPNVFSVICDLKKDDYCALPIEMQRIEANLMIKQVGGKLVEDGIPFLTIHDSIMTFPEHVALVRSRIQEAFNGLGLTPTIT